MSGTAITTKGRCPGEPPGKVARLEGDGERRTGGLGGGEPEGETLFIRCAVIRGRGELVNGFLCKHREALGIQAWYAAADEASDAKFDMILRTDAPLECVFVKTSRKPYFLLECTEGKVAAAGVLEKLKELHNTKYKGYPVIVEVAKKDITVAAERKKLEMRDAARRTSAASTTLTSTSSSRPSATTAFVPRVLRRK